MELEDFLARVRDRVVYIHAHNNDGIKDQHNALDKGTLDWKHVLDKIDLSRVKELIIEATGREGRNFKRTKELLERYFKERSVKLI